VASRTDSSVSARVARSARRKRRSDIPFSELAFSRAARPDGVAVRGEVQGVGLDAADVPLGAIELQWMEMKRSPAGHVGQASALLEADELVGLAGEDDLQPLLGEHRPEPPGDGQGHVLLAGAVCADGAGVVAAVAGVDHHAAELEAELLGEGDLARGRFLMARRRSRTWVGGARARMAPASGVPRDFPAGALLGDGPAALGFGRRDGRRLRAAIDRVLGFGLLRPVVFPGLVVIPSRLRAR
jgi:hypothetical protein